MFRFASSSSVGTAFGNYKRIVVLGIKSSKNGSTIIRNVAPYPAANGVCRHSLSSSGYHSSSTSASAWKTPTEKKFFNEEESGGKDSRVNIRSSSSSSSDSGVFEKIAFIGTGMMAQSIIEPLITTGLQPADKVIIYDVRTSLMNKIAEKFHGVSVADSLPTVVSDADLVICCVKPQNMNASFYEEVQKGSIRDDATFLSIAAGVPLSAYYQTGFSKIVRSMPNTPAQIGKGMTVWCCTQNMKANERDRIKQVLCCLGKTIYVDDEKHVDMSTSISGSGPAYIFMLMEAMIDAGVHMGFPRDQATTLVYQTLLGSTLYAMETGEHPAILRNSVTSPSGTTASALYELENGKFRTVIKDAMWACYERSLEMGETTKSNNNNNNGNTN